MTDDPYKPPQSNDKPQRQPRRALTPAQWALLIIVVLLVLRLLA